MVGGCRLVRGGGRALWHDEQQSLVRVELGVVALAYTAQLGEMLRPLLPEQVGLASEMAQQLAGRGDLETLRGRPVALHLWKGGAIEDATAQRRHRSHVRAIGC